MGNSNVIPNGLHIHADYQKLSNYQGTSMSLALEKNISLWEGVLVNTYEQ